MTASGVGCEDFDGLHRRDVRSATTTAGRAAGLGRGCSSRYQATANENDAADRHAAFWVLRQRQVAHTLLDLELLHGIAFVGRDSLIEVGHGIVVV